MDNFDYLPKRLCVFVDSGSDTQFDSQVTHTLQEAIETEDNEALVVRLIHAQIPTPFPIWMNDSNNTLVAGIRVEGLETGLYGREAFATGIYTLAPEAGGLQTSPYRQRTTGSSAEQNFLQYVLRIPVGGYTPESLAEYLSTTLSTAFTWRQYEGRANIFDNAESHEPFYYNAFPFNGVHPMPMLGMDFHTTIGQVDGTNVMIGEAMESAGVTEIGTTVNLTYNRIDSKFKITCEPREVIDWNFKYNDQFVDAATPVVPLSASNSNATGTDRFNNREVVFMKPSGDYYKTSDYLMKVLGLKDNAAVDTILDGLHSKTYRSQVNLSSYGPGLWQRWFSHYITTPGYSATTLSYPDVARNIYIKTNLSTDSVADSTLGRNNTLAVVPAHRNVEGFHTLSASDSVFSSLVTTQAINNIYLELTDEHNNPLELNFREFTIGLEFQYVRINILHRNIREVRNRVAYMDAKIKKENPKRRRNKKKGGNTISNGFKKVRKQSD